MERDCKKAEDHEAQWQTLYDSDLPCAYCCRLLSLEITPPARHQVPLRPSVVRFRKTVTGAGAVLWNEE